MDYDKFTGMIDEMLTENHVQMLIDIPEGTQDCILKDNTTLGPVAQFYILIKAMQAAYIGFAEMINPEKEEEMIDEVFKMLKQDILEGMKEARRGRK